MNNPSDTAGKSVPHCGLYIPRCGIYKPHREIQNPRCGLQFHTVCFLRSRTELLYFPCGDAVHGFPAILAASEGCKPEVSFTARTESYSGSAHHMHIAQQPVEELPRTDAVGGLHPQVGRVHSAINVESCTAEGITHQLRVAHVIVYGFSDLLPAFRRIDGLSPALGYIACPVELGALPAVAQTVQRHTVSCPSVPDTFSERPYIRSARP